MNLSLLLILSIVILLPGLFFYLFLVNRTNIGIILRSITKASFWVVISCIILHILWLTIFHLLDYKTSFSEIQTLLIIISQPKDNPFTIALTRNLINFKVTFYYFISLFIFSAFLGFAFKTMIKKWDLERKFSWLRFVESRWYYLIGGYDGKVAPKLVSIAAIIDQNDGSYLYVGYLRDYSLDKTGELVELVIEEPFRRKLSSDKQANGNNSETRFYKIDGDYLVIRYRETKNLNLLFWRAAD